MQVGKADVTAVIGRARERLGGHGRRTILFLDEIHRFNKAQQDMLLPVVESGLITLIGATTENPYFEINSALLSRCALFEFLPHTPDDLTQLVERGAADLHADLGEGMAAAIAEASGGDGRAALAMLELAWSTAKSRGVAGRSGRGDRGGDEAAGAVRPRRRRALRRRVGVHQEHARLRSRRGHLLAGGDDRGRRGSEVHRPARDRVRLRGRRQRRSARARDRRGRGARGGVRGAAGGAHQPRPGRRLRGAGAEVERGDHGHRRRPGGGAAVGQPDAAGLDPRRPLSGRQGAGPRRRLRLPARARRLRADAALPARRAGRHALLRAECERLRGAADRAARRPAAPSRGSRGARAC